MQVRTDLAMESNGLTDVMGVETRIRRIGDVEEMTVVIQSQEASRQLNKPCGRYVTLSGGDFIHAAPQERIALARALCGVLRSMLPPQGDLLVVGLGNRHMTADALGSQVIDALLITRHMQGVTLPVLKGRLRGVCAVAPGVLGITGMETAEMVQGIMEHVRPSAVIAIDALAARESRRIGATIQVTDTGISPGSGVGNHRLGLNRETLGVPVIAVGVPMVVYASVIARDALSLLLQDFGIPEQEHASAVDGMIKRVIQEGLGEMVVTPREVDELVGKVARILADGLNLALQPDLTEQEIFALSHDTL